MSFKEIRFPDSYTYSSDSEHIPLEFYNAVFPLSKTVDLFLGYFNSGAFRVLSESFAEFIYNGGSMRMITNHYYTKLDFENLIAEPELDDYNRVTKLIKDLRKLKDALDEHGQHFFDCLKYLIKEDRLQIQPVSFGKQNLSHSKQMLFYDGQDYILTQGSMNFTLAGIVKNSESFQVEVPWNSKVSQVRIQEQRQHFDNVFNKKHSDYTYLKRDDIQKAIDEIGEEKSIRDLLETSKNLGSENYSKRLKEIKKAKKEKFEAIIDKIDNEPRFPYEKPYPYQLEAYDKWTYNGFKGLFAMATGTGKTLTSLLCCIKEYKKNDRKQNIIVVVPGKELIYQWDEEIKNCNFKKPILWYSENSKLNRDIQRIRVKFHTDFNDLNIVITYDSFKNNRFLNLLKDRFTKFTVIFDECHNMGAPGIKRVLSSLKFDRVIGLSATPLRLWDENNENSFIEDFFNSKPPYTFSYNMEEAINNGFLCKYNYEPFFVTFDNDEWEEYLELTQQIPIAREGEKINTTAALKRQLKKDQSRNKKYALKDIIYKLKNGFNYETNNTLIYCPKGENEEKGESYIIELQDYVKSHFSDLNTATFLGQTKDRNLLLEDFENENVAILFAIKCLDEGVNIPKTINAIFIASGQNYREYVQRRGRVLRNYENKGFKKEYANIFDILVLPSVNQYLSNSETGLKLIVSEFKRLYEFMGNAAIDLSVKRKIDSELKKYELTEEFIRSKTQINE